MICMNSVVLYKGRCDCCDARCPYYTSNKALLQAIEGLPDDISVGLKDVAHYFAMRELEEEEFLELFRRKNNER